MSEHQTKIRTALVTGGSRGIGRAVCLALAAKGLNVVVNYAGNETAAAETVIACWDTNPGVAAVAIQADVADADAVTAMVARIKKEFGRIDVLVNNAGITRDNLIMMTKPEDFDAVIATNLRGAFLCTKAVSRLMMKQRYGRIVNLSSVVGLRGNAGQTAYAASKAGIIGLTKSVAKELASRGITANAVAPGFIETDMTDALNDEQKAAAAGDIPLKRLGSPEDVAHAVAFLADEDSGYITGQILAVDGGMAV
ncbi:3-oxoacyl-[acyl-carrier-protein] reductase [Pseudoramibacter alactolyticus]